MREGGRGRKERGSEGGRERKKGGGVREGGRGRYKVQYL